LNVLVPQFFLLFSSEPPFFRCLLHQQILPHEICPVQHGSSSPAFPLRGHLYEGNPSQSVLNIPFSTSNRITASCETTWDIRSSSKRTDLTLDAPTHPLLPLFSPFLASSKLRFKFRFRVQKVQQLPGEILRAFHVLQVR